MKPLLILKDFIDVFTKIITGVIFVCAVGHELYASPDCDGWQYILWRIIICAAITSLISVICLPCTLNDRDVSSREYITRYIIHYILINISTMTMGYYFKWFVLTIPSVIFMALCILFVYLFTVITMYLLNKQYANEINEALNKFNDKNS